jgi:hypothetical protein
VLLVAQGGKHLAPAVLIDGARADLLRDDDDVLPAEPRPRWPKGEDRPGLADHLNPDLAGNDLVAIPVLTHLLTLARLLGRPRNSRNGSAELRTVRAMNKQPAEAYDPRFDRLREFGKAEREMTTALSKMHAEIAHLVPDLTPLHAPVQRIEAVVNASGYSRTLIDALRSRKHSWHR